MAFCVATSITDNMGTGVFRQSEDLFPIWGQKASPHHANQYILLLTGLRLE